MTSRFKNIFKSLDNCNKYEKIMSPAEITIES